MYLISDNTRAGKDYSMSAHILLVEDNVDISEITVKLLLDAGYYVDFVSNGQEALEQFKRHKYDLIITDIFMPVMDGNRFIQELEQYNLYTKVPPVIAMSYNHFDILPSPIITLTALKPIRFGQLLSAISNALGIITPARSSIIS